jgi:hypothetical protein
MRLSEFKGEEALDVLADIIEPITMIMTDKEIYELAKNQAQPIQYISPMIKNHKPELIQILARLDNKTVEEYNKTLTLISLPKQILEMINDPEVQNLFQLQEENPAIPSASSSPATENTEAKGN